MHWPSSGKLFRKSGFCSCRFTIPHVMFYLYNSAWDLKFSLANSYHVSSNGNFCFLWLIISLIKVITSSFSGNPKETKIRKRWEGDQIGPILIHISVTGVRGVHDQEAHLKGVAHISSDSKVRPDYNSWHHPDRCGPFQRSNGDWAGNKVQTSFLL